MPSDNRGTGVLTLEAIEVGSLHKELPAIVHEVVVLLPTSSVSLISLVGSLPAVWLKSTPLSHPYLSSQSFTSSKNH